MTVPLMFNKSSNQLRASAEIGITLYLNQIAFKTNKTKREQKCGRKPQRSTQMLITQTQILVHRTTVIRVTFQMLRFCTVKRNLGNTVCSDGDLLI